MLDSIINFLHIAPLAGIAVLIGASSLSKKISASLISALILALSAVGLMSGSVAHHHHEHMLDPCFGYVAAILFVALKVLNAKPSAVKFKAE